MNEKQLKQKLYIEKNYSEIKELLKNSDDSRSFNMLGKIYLWECNLDEAYKYFNKAQNILGCCYCHLLNEKLEEARILTSLVKDSSPAIKWLSILIDFLEDKKSNENPSYFQIRNFFEQDLELFFIYKKENYINKIIKNISYFEYFNKEIFKSMGRVLLNNNMPHFAEGFCIKSLEIYYNDPETHFLLGETYLIQKKSDKAIKAFKNANEVIGEYLPAIKKLKDLSN